MITKDKKLKLAIRANLKDKTKDDIWLSSEISKCEFRDERLAKRFRTLLEQLWNGIGKSIPFACQD